MMWRHAQQTIDKLRELRNEDAEAFDFASSLIVMALAASLPTLHGASGGQVFNAIEQTVQTLDASYLEKAHRQEAEGVMPRILEIVRGPLQSQLGPRKATPDPPGS